MPALVVTLLLLAAMGAVIYMSFRPRSNTRDVDISADYPVPAPSPQDVGVATPVTNAAPAIHAGITFGKIFWACVCAQLFISVIAWILLEITGVIH